MSLTDEMDRDLSGDTQGALESAASRFGLHKTSGLRSPSRNRAVGGAKTSYHLSGQADDFAGSASAMQQFHNYVKTGYSDQIAEAIHGSGDHKDHVHVAWKKPSITAQMDRELGGPSEMDRELSSQSTVASPVVNASAGQTADAVSSAWPPSFSFRSKGQFNIPTGGFSQSTPQAIAQSAATRMRPVPVAPPQVIPPAEVQAEVERSRIQRRSPRGARLIEAEKAAEEKTLQQTERETGQYGKPLNQLHREQAEYIKSLPEGHARQAAAKNIVIRGEPLGDEARALADFGPVERAIQTVGAPLMSGVGRVASGIGGELESAGFPGAHAATAPLQRAGRNLQEAGGKLGELGYQGPVARFAQGVVSTVPLLALPQGVVPLVLEQYIESRGGGADHVTALKHAALGAAGIVGGGKLGSVLEKDVENVVGRYLARSAGLGTGMEASALAGGEEPSLEQVGHSYGMGGVFGLHGQSRLGEVKTGETVPEKPATIDAQMEALTAGRKQAVLIPRETEQQRRTEGLPPIPDLPESYTTTRTGVGTFIHKAADVTHADVRAKVKDDSFHELLGMAETKGPETTETVVARSPDGEELQSALASPENVPKQADALKEAFPAATVAVEPAEKVIAGRTERDIANEKALQDRLAEAEARGETLVGPDLSSEGRAKADERLRKLGFPEPTTPPQPEGLIAEMDRDLAPARVSKSGTTSETEKPQIVDVSIVDLDKQAVKNTAKAPALDDVKITDILEGKQRALPKTLEAAQLEKGENLTYKPTTVLGGSELGRDLVKEKGVDGAIEHVLHGDAGIEWASTGYAAMEEMRRQEAALRTANPQAADELATRRLKFVGDFAEQATKRGQALAGIRAIEEFAPDRATYIANKLSQKGRKRGLSPEEDSRVTRIAEQLQGAKDRITTLENALAEREVAARKKAVKPKKVNYESQLEEQSKAAFETLKGKLSSLDFGHLERPSERGAIKIGEPPLPGDAELIAQYAAGRLRKAKSVADLNTELTEAFGKDVEPHLAAIRRRAYAIRQEARIAELTNTNTPDSRRQSVLREIQAEITDVANAQREAAKEATRGSREMDRAARAQKAEKTRNLTRQQRRDADIAARTQRIQEGLAWGAEKEAARERLGTARKEYKEASEAMRKAYRASIREGRAAERKANLWDTPLRAQADTARDRLASAAPKAPETMDDLVSVAVEHLLPREEGGGIRMASVRPAKLYVDLKAEFPDLITRKNQGEIYRRAYQRVKDMTTASREAQRLRSATAESRAVWDQMGVDTDAQAILIQRAEAQRERLDAQRQMIAEFNRLSRSRLRRVAFEIQAVPRALQSSIDAPLGRQGLFYLVTHPIETARYTVPATYRGYRALKRGDYHQLVADTQKHPDYRLAEKAGVDLPGIASEVDPRVSAEESFQSTWAERLPHVRLSEQGFTHGMNAQRLAAFSRYADLGRAEGYTFETNPEFFKQVAAYVNAATGRGNMPEALKRATAMTNTLFYSTRLQVSRVQLLNNLLNPAKYVKYNPVMRKAAAGEAIRLAVGMGLIFGTAKAAGLAVTMNPYDPDFGKVVWGKIHYDLTAGEGALIRAVFRFVHSAAKMAQGEQPQRGQEPTKILWDFVRKKLAPWPGTAINLLEGKDVVGHPATLSFKNPENKPTGAYLRDLQDQNQIVRMVAPMVIGDFIDAASEEGWIGTAKTIPALAGVGLSAYEPKSGGGQTKRTELPRPPRPPRPSASR